ncbi:hypothetical protein [Nocardia miyunensis]|uniref:hypothetical protein n=1 Tax=Nocardia miyunensis TaxID=282684 RepID=UPI000B041372|nr:hypothetical protein [Nocardia miyunensis]
MLTGYVRRSTVAVDIHLVPVISELDFLTEQDKIDIFQAGNCHQRISVLMR